MKKSAILASAIALTLSGAVVADSTMYGKARIYFQSASSTANVDRAGLNSYSSRLGWKGSEDLGNGMSSIYQFEVDFDANGARAGGATNTIFNYRLGYVGLKGDFGQFALGRQYTPTYALVAKYHDPFNAPHGGNLYATHTPNRVADAISYTKKFGAVTVAAAILSDLSTDETADSTHFAVSIPAGPVTIGVAVSDFTDANPANERSPTTIDIGWNGDGMSVHLGLVSADTGTATEDSTILTGKFKVGASGQVIAQFEDNDVVDHVALEYNHKLSKKTSWFVGMVSGDIEGDQTNVGLHVNF